VFVGRSWQLLEDITKLLIVVLFLGTGVFLSMLSHLGMFFFHLPLLFHINLMSCHDGRFCLLIFCTQWVLWILFTCM